MMPFVGSTCLFTFTTQFATLNGVYTTRGATTFAAAIASQVDFVANLYTPAGLSATNYQADYASYQNDNVAILESVADNTVVYYVPESALALVPDPTIKEYVPLTLVVDLGVQQNTQAILPLLNTIKDAVQASLGSTNPCYVLGNKVNKVYLTDTQYQALVTARAENVQTLIPLSLQLQNEVAKNTYLAAKVAAYEALIASLA